MKTIVRDIDELYPEAAAQLLRHIKEKPCLNMALSGEKEVIRLYEMLLELGRAENVSFEGIRVFSLQEFSGLAQDDLNSLNGAVYRNFVSKCGMKAENFIPLTDDNYERFDERISEAGGLDIAVVNLGNSARFGFNEIATQFLSRTHTQKLTSTTRDELAHIFSGEENVPERGITMGIKTVTDAKSIIALAVGEGRAKALYKTLYGRNDSVVPGAFLQLPSDVTIYADTAAASQL